MSNVLFAARKLIITLLIFAVGWAALPVSTAAAQGEQPPGAEFSRMEEVYGELVDWYTYQTEWMDQADDTIARTQDMIDKATAHGFDASAVQEALDTFAVLYPEARPYNLEAAAILETHPGFDEAGNVTDMQDAIATLKDLQAALNNAFETMGGENHAGGALIEAVKTFLDEIRPHPSTTIL